MKSKQFHRKKKNRIKPVYLLSGMEGGYIPIYIPCLHRFYDNLELPRAYNFRIFVKAD